MNQTIEFKKDCIMKTFVSEITNINLTHDYKILSDTVEGCFDVTGSYKITKSSINEEEFMFSIPFTIALSPTIDKDTINITLEDFKYNIEKDVLHLVMNIDMEYQEIEIKEEENNSETTKIEEEDEEENTMDEIINMMDEKIYHNDVMNDVRTDDTKEEINSILNEFKDDNEYYKYKIYIVRKEDTIESIAIKYNVSMEDLREYNNIESINIGDKIIIPYIKIDEDK